ncbi:hypothetical protein SAMN04488535_1544 [Corynebacterium mycetoides]|uniref:DUF5318 domain-containing protein n=1 Tax=Corynebacterium mycetoides TaxID=38302 RepID=A0A1G9PPS5_9CORY|nr:DUF5318 family protein [Corynebacterium mycetoides]SDM00709.1 hypothetical protein SAMN04488535_1544 [Corynebacterium mycetoides]
MFAYTREVSHEWLRRTLLREFHAGRVPVDEVCDADFLLRAAAEYHGHDAPRPCPICGKTMREVSWVYGDNLGRRSGTARSEEEIGRLVDEVGPITVHVVEVCPHCRWNYLLREVTAAPVV